MPHSNARRGSEDLSFLTDSELRRSLTTDFEEEAMTPPGHSDPSEDGEVEAESFEGETKGRRRAAADSAPR